MGFLAPCRLLADLGCDHGWVPIAAVARGIAERTIGVDRRWAPLDVARANVVAAELSHRVDLRHGSGLAPLAGEPVDALVLAGLGAAEMVRVLDAGPLDGVAQILLQPNTEPARVRAWAAARGWHLHDEALVVEAGRRFVVLSLRPGEGPDPAYDWPGFSVEALQWLGPWLVRRAETQPYYAEQLRRVARYGGRHEKLKGWLREALG